MNNNDHVLAEIARHNPFDDFRIVRERHGLWYCGKPGTGNMSFRVVFAPGMLMLYGDIGEIIFMPNDRHSLRWAYGDVFRPAYPYYPMSKISPQMREKEFLPERVEEWLIESIRDHRKNGDPEDVRNYIKFLRAWRSRCADGPLFEQSTYYELCSEHRIDDPPSCSDYPCRTYWCFQAMCWFMSHVNPDDPRFAEEMKP